MHQPSYTYAAMHPLKEVTATVKPENFGGDLSSGTSVQVIFTWNKLNYYQPPNHTVVLSSRPQHVATAHHQQNDTSVGTLLLPTAAVSIIKISSVKVDNVTVEWLTDSELHPFVAKTGET